MTKTAMAAFLVAVSFSGAAHGQSLNEFVSAGQLASFCADRDVGSTTGAALTLADGQSIRGEVHCDASAVAGGRANDLGVVDGTPGYRPTLPEQASDEARAAVASAGSNGAAMREQNVPADIGRPDDAGNSGNAGGPANAGGGNGLSR
ncbi:hypothetical protein [Devosia sp.]|uniref:hypothetical protein n=1 Tax=Devosia sp. TaxID=1871048 RepID=UPI002732E226|nr:hypothetical protein [Devosia sp.]MDP2778942.1 hypothetical protein [Devosia sp.]